MRIQNFQNLQLKESFLDNNTWQNLEPVNIGHTVTAFTVKRQSLGLYINLSRILGTSEDITQAARLSSQVVDLTTDLTSAVSSAGPCKGISVYLYI